MSKRSRNEIKVKVRQRLPTFGSFMACTATPSRYLVIMVPPFFSTAAMTASDALCTSMLMHASNISIPCGPWRST